MKAVVTGASGFLGRALVAALIERGVEVWALVRRTDAAAELARAGANVHRGDLRDRASLAGLVREDDVVFHAAARVDMRGAWRDFERTTVLGTRNLLDAALPARPRRFTYISSGAVYGTASDSAGCCADRTAAQPAAHNFYGRAKLLAEAEVRESCVAARCEWSIARLGFLYGEGNRALLQHLGPLLAKRRVILIGKGHNRFATLHVGDAVEAVLLCGAHRRAAGRTYDVAADEVVTQKQFLEATADALGLPRPWRNVRVGLARPIARVVESACRLVGRQPPFTRAMVDLMGTDQVIDAHAIRTELNWRPRVDFSTGMRRMADWYARQSRPIR